MPNEKATSKCLLAFGAGLAVGMGAAMVVRTKAPRGVEFLHSVMQKLGFEWGDILLLLWDPEATAPAAELAGLGESKRVTPVKELRKSRKTPVARRKVRTARQVVSRTRGRSSRSTLLLN